MDEEMGEVMVGWEGMWGVRNGDEGGREDGGKRCVFVYEWL